MNYIEKCLPAFTAVSRGGKRRCHVVHQGRRRPPWRWPIPGVHGRDVIWSVPTAARPGAAAPCLPCAVGCFSRHSGWNSDVQLCKTEHAWPMVCWPVFADQYTNCKSASTPARRGAIDSDQQTVFHGSSNSEAWRLLRLVEICVWSWNVSEIVCLHIELNSTKYVFDKGLKTVLYTTLCWWTRPCDRLHEQTNRPKGGKRGKCLAPFRVKSCTQHEHAEGYTQQRYSTLLMTKYRVDQTLPIFLILGILDRSTSIWYTLEWGSWWQNPCCMLASFSAATLLGTTVDLKLSWSPKSTSCQLQLQISSLSRSHCIQCRPRREHQSWLTPPQPSSQKNDIKPQTSWKCTG